MADISTATKRNFEKLNKDLNSHKFSSRANKHDSKKNIVPVEYYSNLKNVETINEILLKLKPLPLEKAITLLIISFLADKNLINIVSTVSDDKKNEAKITSPYKYINKFISTLKFDSDFDLNSLHLPLDEKDPIGIVYQQLITEGEKNKKGSYYTPKKIVQELMDFSVSKDATFCDPCCGTGGFLLEAIQHFSPDKIFGYDIDPIAIKIARANLLAKYPEIDFNENLKFQNFLTSDSQKYDYFISNPPWGSITNQKEIPSSSIVTSKESFSYFVENAIKNLSPNGFINFLLPVSILNVKTHKDIRTFILENAKIQQVNTYGKCFKGVMTDVISLKLSKFDFTDSKNSADILNSKKSYCYSVKTVDGLQFECPVSVAVTNKNHNIPLLDKIDFSIIQKIQNKSQLNLQNATFALGIVTGNNKEILKNQPSENLRPIITGKEIKKYYSLEPQNFIIYNRRNFQQICPDWIFQEETKFLYKFIFKKPVFSLDQNKLLALNSANIMIAPKDFPLNNYVLLALLNSDPISFYFMKIVNQVKILKEDIQNLPLPFIDLQLQNKITKLVRNIINSRSSNYDDVENLFFDFYDFTEQEIQRIESVV